jgi:hypothetical protein
VCFILATRAAEAGLPGGDQAEDKGWAMDGYQPRWPSLASAEWVRSVIWPTASITWNWADAERLWGLVGLIVLMSILLHGLTVTPIMRFLDRLQGRNPDTEERTPPPGLQGPSRSEATPRDSKPYGLRMQRY